MDQRALFAVNTSRVLSVPNSNILKKGIPIGNRPLFLTRHTSITTRALIDGKIQMESTARVDIRINQVSLVSSLAASILTDPDPPRYLLLLVEGGSEVARVILLGADDSLFESFAEAHPKLSLTRYDLPPYEITEIDSPPVLLANIFRFLAERDPDLFARRTDRFLRDPHILTQLLSHVMGLASDAQLDFIPRLRRLADILRDRLGPWIRSIERNHRRNWEEVMGQRISFADGGVSRIIGLPGADPMGVRVGMYTVVPGEEDPTKREAWKVYSYCLGDVLTDRSSFEVETATVDRKRAQEAARYILEPMSLLRLIDEGEAPDYAFLHGPLQNAFETYDEQAPNYTPGVDRQLLQRIGIDEDAVCTAIADIPSDYHGRRMWNQCIPVYLYLMNRLAEQQFPVAGVVERSGGLAYTVGILDALMDAGSLTSGGRAQILRVVHRYEITDEFLLGCILKEGEYIKPIELQKNFRNRAHDKWAQIVSLFPKTSATVLKTSPNAFPFRVEMNPGINESMVTSMMDLLYHTALLLPNYAFPVGLDIVDSYAKIPDWLSKGVSSTLASSVLARAMQTGNAEIVHQLRQLLARSPRDFFYRPRS